MNVERLFESALKGYGYSCGRFDPSGHGPILRGLYERVLGVGRSVVARCGLPDIHVDLIDDASVNAVAFHAGGVDFIGIHEGTVRGVYDVFRRMLAHPLVLPDIGNAIDEEVREGVIRRVREGSTDKVSFAATADLGPLDPTRLQYTRALADHAIHFLIAHEVAHILHGHLEFNGGITGARLHAEYAAHRDQPRLHWLDCQALESDADFCAVNRGIDAAFATDRDCAGAELGWRLAFVDSAARYRAWSFAMTTLMLLFGSSDFERLNESHPPPLLRRFSNLATALSVLKEKLPHELDPVLTAAINPLEADAAFSLICNEPPPDRATYEGLLEAFEPRPGDHTTRVRAQYAVLSHELHPRAGHIMAPAAYDLVTARKLARRDA